MTGLERKIHEGEKETDQGRKMGTFGGDLEHQLRGLGPFCEKEGL